jgi:hypothetical protein
MRLVQHKEGWDVYIKTQKDLSAENQKQLTAEGQRIMAGLNEAHEAELERRQAALSALAQYLQNQQIINNMNRPIVTNCNQFGNTTNCVTH